VLVQCIANNNHFRAAPMSDQAYQAELEKFLVGTIKRIVGQL
jgi:hypothetical protein